MKSTHFDGVFGVLAGRCPRCHGNCIEEKDGRREIKFCLACGRRWNLDGSKIEPNPKLKHGHHEEW